MEEQSEEQPPEMTPGMTEEEKDELFDFIDSNDDGQISVAEIRTFLQLKQCNPTKSEINTFLEEKGMDSESEVCLSREDFKALATEIMAKLPDPGTDLDDAIDTLDTNRDGQISKEELKMYMTQRGEEQIDEETFDALMSDLGVSEEDTIDRGEHSVDIPRDILQTPQAENSSLQKFRRLTESTTSMNKVDSQLIDVLIRTVYMKPSH